MRRRLLPAAPSALLLCAMGLAACATAPPAQESASFGAAPPDLGRCVQAELLPGRPEGSLLADPAALMRRLARTSPALAAQRARVEQARAALAQSELHADPTLNAGLGGAVGQRNPSDLGWNDTTNWNLGLQESFEIGKRGPRMAAARLRLEEEQSRLADVAGEQAHLARAALAREVYLRSRLALMEESSSGARQMLEVERGRLEHGDMSSNDFDRLTLDTTLLEIDLPRTRSEHEEALAEVHALLGPDCPLGTETPEALAASAAVPQTQDLEGVLAARPDHRALELERRASNQDALLAAARRLPDPVLGLGFLHDNLTAAGNQPNSLQLSLGLRLPFFDRGQHDSRRSEEHAIEVEKQLDGSLREAEADVHALVSRQAALSSVLQRLDEEALPKSRQVLEASTSAFNRGQISLTDVLLTRRTHTELQLRRIDLVFDSFGVRNDLRRALGVDSELFASLGPQANP